MNIWEGEKWEKEGNKPKVTLNDREQTIKDRGLMEGVGGKWATWVMGIKEGICHDEHWVLYVSYESLNSTPKTNVALYVN